MSVPIFVRRSGKHIVAAAWGESDQEMNGPTKILTVSYGTFSCTLEGFDDPLGTMRELAEYFRDLAADDRYFGAEPPTPDVEMLQNIAQREVRRKVEARPSATGISLTQVEAPAKPQTDAPEMPQAEKARQTPEPATFADHDKGPLTFDDDFLMADEPEDVLAVDPDAAINVEGPAETVAEKLRRIRAVVSRRPEQDAGNSFKQAQAQNPNGKRERALTKTIRQIQDDLSDDEEVMPAKSVQPDDVSETAAHNTPEDAQPVDRYSADDTHADTDEDTADVTTTKTSADAEPFIDTTTDEDTYEDEDDDTYGGDGRSVSQFLENVSGKISDSSNDTAGDHRPKPTPRPLAGGRTDADVGRLLEETDNKLKEDGVVRRRQVISQMRAAVAATKADRAVTRLISVEDTEEEEKEAYRNDLSDVVGKTKPMSEQAASRKLAGPPLVLVSSQRVADDSVRHDDEAQVEKPAANPEQSAPSKVSFARFVENHGAKGLDELLEAAAAYTVFTKGQESFSRPEIMKRVAMVDPALSLSREDGLRSFGQLLRQGKFQKLDRGQFTIDEDTRFNPEKRIAGE